MRKTGRKPRIIVVSCPFFCYFIVQVQNVSSPLHNLICGLVHISEVILPPWLDIANYKANVSTVSYFCQGAKWNFFMMLFSWMVIEIIDEISQPVSFFLVQSCGCV